MKPQLRHVGEGRHPVVVIDDFLGAVGPVVDAASALTPFPSGDANYYPGVRRRVAAGEGAADDYVRTVMERVGPFLAGAFGTTAYNLVEASFSMVTTPAEQLLPMQRAPHFDTTDPDHIAMIHYLNVPSPSATAFFRQRSTGIERVTDDSVDRFVDAAKVEASKAGYVQGSDAWFDELDRIEAIPDRLVFYQGGLLHSGIIPPDMPLDPDPRVGRLTANFFIQLDRNPT